MLRSLADDMLAEAKEYFINRNYRMAEPILQQMLLQNTRNPEVHQMLATIYYSNGQFSKAIKTFRRALEIDPTYTDASVGLSIILNDLGKYEEGKKVFIEAQDLLEKRSGKGDPYIDEKIAIKHEELADLYFQNRRFNESLENLLKAQKLSSRQVELVMRISEVYLKLDKPERAIKDLRHLIRENPHYIPARIKLGVVYYNMNNIAEATEQWESVVLRDPQHTEAIRYLRMAQAAGITSLDNV